MAYNRTRTRIHSSYTGSARNRSTGAISTKTVSTGDDYMEDVVGNPTGVNHLWAVQTQLTPGHFSGTIQFLPINDYMEYPYTAQPGFYLPTAGLTAMMPSNALAVTEAVRKTNPSRADVSVPNFLFELRDVIPSIPKNLMDFLSHFVKPDHVLGRTVRQRWSSRERRIVRDMDRTSNSAVQYNFGWELAIRDLQQMFNFVESVDKRVDELKRVYSKGGLKRRRTTFTNSLTSTSTGVILHSSEASVIGTRKYDQKIEQWVTVRWLPIDANNLPSAAEQLSLARKLVHGWDFSAMAIASTLWDAMPWSWFIDYFANFGDFLAAHRNGARLVPSGIAVMRSSTTTVTDTISATSNGIKAVGAKAKRVTLRRDPGSLSLTARVPFLSHKQVLTLSSIAVSHSRFNRTL